MLVNSAESPYGSFSDYTSMNPYESPYESDGSLRRSLTGNINNPLYEAQAGNFNKSNNFSLLNTTSLQVWIRKDLRLNGASRSPKS